MSDSMNNAVDVAYQTEINIENKSTEELTVEINIRYKQAESLAALSYKMLTDAGERLIEIKSRVPHGQFETWCAEHLEFSKSKAEKMMKLAESKGHKQPVFKHGNVYGFGNFKGLGAFGRTRRGRCRGHRR